MEGIEQLTAFLKDNSPAGEKRWAVGVSGGPDSMALCHMLSRCAEALGVDAVHALTVDHGLREESMAEAEKVGEWIAGWPRVKHKILQRNADNISPTKLQEQARNDRYALIADDCARHDIRALFMAHHQDDQAETFLFRLAKGSGLDGLAAMRAAQCYDGNLTIYRPLLDIPKAEILAYCAAHDISYIRDSSNQDTQFARVRLRESAAVLEKEGLGAKRLGTTARRILRARMALETLTEQAFDALAIKETKRIEYNIEGWKKQPEEIRLRLLLKAMQAIDNKTGTRRDYNPRMEKLEHLLARLDREPGFKRATLGGFMIARDRKNGRITIEKEEGGAT